MKKRYKWIKETPMSRLSALPDCLIIHILSLLEVKQSAITALLSKRFQFLWTQSPRLIFRKKRPKNEQDFVSRVNRTLVIYDQNDLDTFEVEFPYSKSYSPDVDVWVGFAVKNKAKQVSLLLNHISDEEELDRMYTLPRTMFQSFRSAHLKRLTLRGCVVAPLGTIEWPSLTELSIEHSKLEQHVMDKMLSGCPVLHCLVLIFCWGFDCLEVSSKSLYELRVSDPDEYHLTTPLLQISAPYLHTLSVTLYPKERKLCLENTPSLVRATLDFVCGDWEDNEEIISNAKELLDKIRHVKVVDLRYSYMQALSSVAINDYPFPQSARTCLTVEVPLEECSIHVLVGLLESSPKLESLVIEGSHMYTVKVDTLDIEGSLTYWPCTCPDSKAGLDCDLLHLKSIVFKDFEGPDFVGELMLTLARMLLNKTPALEKMVVHDERFTSSPQPAVNESFEIEQKLLSFPSAYVKQLTLRGCTVAPRGTIEWPSLTKLHIEDAELQQHVIEKILSGCPVLHCLVLEHCWGFNRLEVCSKSLYELCVSDSVHYGDFDKPLLQISAPNLHTLSVFLNPRGNKLLCLENISSLVRASIDFAVYGCYTFSAELMSNAKEILEKIRHVKVVDLRYGYIEVLSPVAINDYRFPQSARTCLSVDVPTIMCSIHVLVGILESSPNLESLAIETYDNFGGLCTCLDSKTDLDFDLLHLKSIVIKDYSSPNCVGELMLTLARILLNKTPALEKMEFHNKRSPSSPQLALQRSLTTAQKLLSYPRSSKAVVLLK